jgi:hypothetical protein
VPEKAPQSDVTRSKCPRKHRNLTEAAAVTRVMCRHVKRGGLDQAAGGAGWSGPKVCVHVLHGPCMSQVYAQACHSCRHTRHGSLLAAACLCLVRGLCCHDVCACMRVCGHDVCACMRVCGHDVCACMRVCGHDVCACMRVCGHDVGCAFLRILFSLAHVLSCLNSCVTVVT